MPKENRIKRSLKFSFLEGVFSSSMGGLTSNYFTPYALALKATTAQVGVLAVAPSLATSVAQLLSAKVTDIFKSRKKVISIFVLLNILSFLPVVFVSYLFKDQPVLWLIFFMILYSGFNSLAGPVMSALLAEYIPGDKRGQYFGWRSKALGIITIVVSLAAGFILHFFKKNALQGFLVIFSLALLARFLSWYFINLMYEPPLRLERVSAFNLADFTKNLLKSNFARYTFSISAFHFCVNLAAPFFSLFMLRELKFSYLTYTVIVTTVTAVSILTIERWGRVADRIGNVKVVKFTALLIAVIPFLWILNHNPLYLFLVQAFSGLVWS
ncbi:MAG: MFS transporter, partial [Candidatus Omnitrophica bacterium]|nr:MFS transporter [Candidatus Omnitrophota bacterium]